MAYFITDACISCGACESECPVSCISPGDSVYVIDADACIECGACANVALLMLLSRNNGVSKRGRKVVCLSLASFLCLESEIYKRVFKFIYKVYL